MKFNYALWQQLQNENRKSIGRNIVSFSLLRWTGFCTGPEANQNKKQSRGNKEQRENMPDHIYQRKKGASATPNPPVIFPLSYFHIQTQCSSSLIVTFASNQQTVMDSTCTPPTLIIVDVWICPAPCLEVSDEKAVEFKELHMLRQTQPDILFSITHLQSIRISGISSLIIMPHWRQCVRTHT